MKHDIQSKVNLPLEPLLQARLHNPFSCLGVQRDERGYVVRVFNPYAQRIWLQTEDGTEPFERVSPEGLHEWHGDTPPAQPYRLQSEEDGVSRDYYDPYAFPLQISEHDLYLFNEGKLYQAYRMLGSHQVAVQGVTGIRFAVWAPNAERVSVVGDFNHWDGRLHPMAVHGASGVWELFIPGLQTGVFYKYEIRHRGSGSIHIKTDPYAQAFEIRPGTASRTAMSGSYQWSDSEWMAKRSRWNWLHQPLNIYELHVGSWKRHPDGRVYSYRDLIQYLIPYILEMGYTHIELLPVSEHPLDESWGYQTTGYFAATSRYGNPDDLRAFIDACHNAGIGVLLDWVPAHFPQDNFALARFDGTALYEHEDPRLGYHHDWGTHIFNYGRNEVKSFLLSSAYYWLSEFHIDGLRVDAVASMLYLDYSRKPGEWLPNKFGGRENLDAIEFLRSLNIMVHDSFPGALTLAEESTAWPSVSRPVYLGGLGFSMKWNMGWMNDTLSYMQRDPIHRRYHHNQLTFGQIYAYSENFVLPLSHDEVVHGKESLLGKMPGDGWQKFANVRLLLSYQMTTPGKKLNFMGNELAQGIEWRVQSELEWWQLGHAWHQGVQAMVRDLNRWYRELPALHELDFSHDGFAWIDCNDADQSVLVYQRRACDGSFVILALNFTPVPRLDYCIGVPQAGCYREIFNSDSHYYGGSNLGNGNDMHTNPTECMGQNQSLNIVLPPLAAVMIVRV